MKIDKNNTKYGFKNQFILISEMIIFNIISLAIFKLSYIGIKPTGNIINNLSFSSQEYEVNFFYVILSWLLYVIIFSIFYSAFFKKIMKNQSKIHFGFIILFIISFIIFIITEAMIYLIILIDTTNFGSIINYPNYIYILLLIYFIGYIAFDIYFEKIDIKNHIL